MNIFERIETEFKQSPSEIMERLGISKAYYSMTKNGKSSISKNLAIKINREYDIPLEDIFFCKQVHEALTEHRYPTGTEGK